MEAKLFFVELIKFCFFISVNNYRLSIFVNLLSSVEFLATIYLWTWLSQNFTLIANISIWFQFLRCLPVGFTLIVYYVPKTYQLMSFKLYFWKMPNMKMTSSISKSLVWNQTLVFVIFCNMNKVQSRNGGHNSKKQMILDTLSILSFCEKYTWPTSKIFLFWLYKQRKFIGSILHLSTS